MPTIRKRGSGMPRVGYSAQEREEIERKGRAQQVHQAALILAAYKAVDRDLVTRLEVLAEQIYEGKL